MIVHTDDMTLDWLIDIKRSRYGSNWWGDDERDDAWDVRLGYSLIADIDSPGDTKQSASMG